MTRGQDYVVTFDQASVVGDTPGTGIANVFGEPATVPYVEAPTAIAVTKVSAGNYPEVSFVDADGNTLAWFGETTKMLSTSGIDKGEIYYAKSKLNDPEKGTKQGVKINTPGNVEKGVWKSDVKAKVNDNKYIDAYWFASVTTTKGIFGKDAVTLTSEAVPTAQKSADTIDLVESSTTATTGTVKFTNLRANGTVYIVRGLKERTEKGKGADVWNGEDYFSTPDKVFKAYEAGINEAIVGKTTVEAGAASVDVAQTISEYEAAAKIDSPDAALGTNTAGYFPTNNYIAVFVPDDEDNYGMIYTADGWKNTATKQDDSDKTDSQGLSLEQVATSLSYDKNTLGTLTGVGKTFTITGTTLTAKDQFGKAMVTAQLAKDVTSVVTDSKDAATIEAGTAKFEVAAGTGQVTIYLNVKDDTDAGDGYKITLLGKEVTVYNKSGDKVAGAAKPGAFEVKVGDDVLFKAQDSILGTAVFTFDTFTGQPGVDDQIATFTGALKDDTATITLQKSADTITWTDVASDGSETMVLGTGKVSMAHAAAADIKANTYYRLMIAKANYATAYVNMTGKTAAAKLHAIAALNDENLTTGTAGGALGTTDQFDDAYAVPTAAVVTPTDGNTGGTITLALDADKKLTVNVASTDLVKNDSFECVLGDVTIYAKVNTAGASGVAKVTVDITDMPAST